MGDSVREVKSIDVVAKTNFSMSTISINSLQVTRCLSFAMVCFDIVQLSKTTEVAISRNMFTAIWA